MRLIKMLGLAALAATAAMAFVGASSVMAESTAVCNSNESGGLTCAWGNRTKELHGVSVGQPVLQATSSFVTNVKCLSSLSTATLLALSSPQVVHINEVTWTHCYETGGIGALCTVETALTGSGTILKTGGSTGTITLPEVSVSVTCGNVIKCTYKLAEGVTLKVTSATELINGHVTAESVAVEGDINHLTAVCPAATWTALYENLTPVYVKS